ncbi:MAG: sigma-70 family RNA polymerase sigma factor [Pirellulaceae bacterium]|nr:sigma-70 family RNA polymerase sigma factor [Pirellulaceae bacterium]
MPETPLIKRFLQHQNDFMSYLMAITRDLSAAEEIFQNAAIVVMERSVDDEPIRDFRAWSKEIVRRQALRHLRDESKNQWMRSLEPLLLDQITRVFLEDDSSEMHAKQQSLALRQCVSESSEVHRKMLALRYEQRASFADIGQAIDRSEMAVQRSLSRLRKRLYDCVQSKLRLAEHGG